MSGSPSASRRSPARTRRDDTPYDACVRRIDALSRSLAQGIITVGEYEQATGSAVGAYLRLDDPRDDLDLLIRYARATIEGVALDPLNGDRTCLERFDRRIRATIHEPVARADLDSVHNRIRSGQAQRHWAAAAELLALCRHGLQDRISTYVFLDHILLTLDLAHELRSVDALVEAIHPGPGRNGQLGAPDAFDGRPRAHAFNHLASLATIPGPRGEAAREALVGLTGLLETAGMAVVRLPAHLLSRRQADRLMEYLDLYEHLLRRDPILMPGHEGERVPDAIRSVVWLSNDAAHFH